jgi:hypothetical protein
MAIESFWVHARNLNEFFTRQSKNKEGAPSGVSAARDFTDDGFKDELQLRDLETLIDQQICHLQYERGSNAPEGLGAHHIWRVKADLEREVIRFETHLTTADGARALWDAHAKPATILSDAFHAQATDTTTVTGSISALVMHRPPGGGEAGNE